VGVIIATAIFLNNSCCYLLEITLYEFVKFNRVPKPILRILPEIFEIDFWEIKIPMLESNSKLR